ERSRIFNKLEDIRDATEGYAKAYRSGNDVIAIYYEGDEEIGKEATIFHRKLHGSGTTNPESDSAITCDQLMERLGDTPGAHIVLLDVDRKPPAGTTESQNDKILHWQDFFSPDLRRHLSVLRYSWAGNPASPRLLDDLKKILPNAFKFVEIRTGLRPLAA